MSEGGSAGSDDLDEGVQVLDLVGVLGGVGIDTVHAATLRSAEDTNLSLVDIVVHTVESSDDDHGGETDAEGLEVMKLVNGTGTHGVLVKSAHGPAERTALLTELSVVTFTCLGEKNLVVGLGVLRERQVALGVDVATAESGLVSDGGDGLLIGSLASIGSLLGVVGLRGSNGAVLLLILTTVLHHSVVGDGSTLGISRGLTLEQSRTLEDVVPLQGVVLLDDLAVDERNEEDGSENEQAEADTESDGSDVPSGLVGQTETGRALVDDGEGADGTGDEEEEGGGPDSPGDRVGAEVDDDLDEHLREEYGQSTVTETRLDC